MKVWNNTFYSRDLIEVLSFSRDIFINKLAHYFERKYYGKDVNEVFYIEVCEDPIFTPNPAGSILHYGKQKKMVQVGLCLDFEIVSTLDGRAFCRYLANKYLERSLDIEELGIQGFDLEQYIKDLESFFRLNAVL